MIPVDDYEKIVAESLNCGVALYIVKSWSTHEFQNIWRHVLEVRKGGLVASTSSLNDVAQHHQVYQRIQPKESSEHKEVVEDSNLKKKKPKLKWTKELKGEFLEAIEQLEDDQESKSKLIVYVCLKLVLIILAIPFI